MRHSPPHDSLTDKVLTIKDALKACDEAAHESKLKVIKLALGLAKGNPKLVKAIKELCPHGKDIDYKGRFKVTTCYICKKELSREEDHSTF